MASTGRPVPVRATVEFQYSMYSFWYWRLATLTAEISAAQRMSIWLSKKLRGEEGAKEQSSQDIFRQMRF